MSFSFFKLGESITLDPTREESEASETRITFGSSRWKEQYMINSCQKKGVSTLTSDEIDKMMELLPKKFDELNERDLTFISSLPKDVNHLGKPFKLHLGRYGLYLKDDNNINHKIEKKLWSSFM